MPVADCSSSSSSPAHTCCGGGSGRWQRRRGGVRRRWYLCVAALCWLCYSNAMSCGFVFDDASAVRDNRDLRPGTPLGQLFANDFWGTPIHKAPSSRSVRALRRVYDSAQAHIRGLRALGGTDHSKPSTCPLLQYLMLRLCVDIPPPRSATVSASLTLAIGDAAGAAILSAPLGIAPRPLLWGMSHLPSLPYYPGDARISTNLYGCTIDRTFSRRTQIYSAWSYCLRASLTALAPLFQLRPWHVSRGVRLLAAGGGCGNGWLRDALQRTAVLLLGALCLLAARVHVMGAQLPVFTKFDNPAAVAPTPARQLTFSYLLPLNSWLLLCPWGLCCDWTMGSVPLVESFTDPRNAATLTLLVALVALTWTALFSASARHSDVIFFSLSLVAFPFLPASNLFFHVGFVVAERILYLPSMGVCLLVAHGWDALLRNAHGRFLWIGLLLVITTHSIKTFIRNYDWESEYSIFMAGLRVNRQNAKLYNNVGHALEGQGKFAQALEYFLKAASVQPDDIGAHINVGRTYNNLLMYEEAEKAFWKAKDLLPQPRPGEPYKARIAPNHLNVFLNLANLISRNGSRLEEADGLYRQAISMRVDYIQAYINRGDILIKLNRTKEAQEVYQRALQLDATNADIHYNLGVVFLEQGKPDDALTYFNKALELDPGHEQALMNSAIVIQESGSPKLRQVAFQRLERLLERGKANERVYFNLGMLSMDESKPQDAERWFQDAIRVKADFRSALFNLALLLSDSGRHLEAVPHLLQLLESHPDHVKGLILLGDIYINHMKDVDKAEECYQRILSVEPSHVQAMHNLCVVHVQRGFLLRAEACLQKVLRVAPHERYIAAHLDVVRDRIRRW
ncbi:unnamed protein product, partial [Ixodes persulcatus]